MYRLYSYRYKILFWYNNFSENRFLNFSLDGCWIIWHEEESFTFEIYIIRLAVLSRRILRVYTDRNQTNVGRMIKEKIFSFAALELNRYPTQRFVHFS